jgi:hypothetical protein
VGRLLESGEPWFAAAQTLLVGVAVALAVGVALRLLARRMLRDEDRAQRTSLIAFWGVVAIFGVIAIVRLVGGPNAEAGLTAAGTRLFTTLPDLVVALVILVAGTVLAAAAKGAVTRALASGRPRYAEPLSAAASAGIIAVAVLLAARQIGVQTALADGIVLALFAGLLLAGALAAGLGGRGVAEAWAAGRHTKDILTVGDVVELDGRRGRVLRLGPTSVRLGLPGGAFAEVPNTALLQSTVVVFEHEEPDVGDSEPIAPQDVDDEAPTRTFAPRSDAGATAAAAGGPPPVEDPDDALAGAAADGEPSGEPASDAAESTRVLEPGWRQRAEAARAALERAEQEHLAASGRTGADEDDDEQPTEAFEPPQR